MEPFHIVLFVISLGCGLWAASVAAAKQRSGLGFGLVGFAFGLVGVLITHAVSGERRFDPTKPYAR